MKARHGERVNIGTTRNYLALLAAALLALSSSAAAAVHLQLDRTRITEGANEVLRWRLGQNIIRSHV